VSDFLVKIRSEYKTLLDTKFWGVYTEKIMALRNSASTDTDTIDPVVNATKLARSQGKIDAFDTILNLPNKIVEGK